MKTILTIVAALTLFATPTGCARFVMPSAAQLNALARDTNSSSLKIVSIYGTLELRRNAEAIAP